MVAGVGVSPVVACRCCGETGHFQDQCHVLEVGTTVPIPDALQSAMIRLGCTRYHWVQGGTYHALVESVCNLRLVHGETLGTARRGKVRCGHGDGYPLVPVKIQFQRQKQ